MNSDSSETKMKNLKDEIKDKSVFETKIKAIYNVEYDEVFPTILQFDENDFIANLIYRIHLIFVDLYSDQYETNKKVTKLLTDVEKNLLVNKYRPDIEKINHALSRGSTKSPKKEPLCFFKAHCEKSGEDSIHHCGNKFIQITDRKKGLTHLYCSECNLVYNKDSILIFCTHCNKEYLTEVLDEDSKNYEPATWDNYHCGAIVNEQMHCINCEDFFFIRLSDKKLYCKSCKTECKPKTITWNCFICKSDFKAGAKVFNALEFKIANSVIKNALIFKEKARPEKVPCCKIGKIEDHDFFHSDECLGKLYLGTMDRQDVVVCEECKMISNYDNVLWTCPICRKRFRQKGDKNKNMERDDILFSPVIRKPKSPNQKHQEDEKNNPKFMNNISLDDSKPIVKPKNYKEREYVPMEEKYEDPKDVKAPNIIIKKVEKVEKNIKNDKVVVDKVPEKTSVMKQIVLPIDLSSKKYNEKGYESDEGRVSKRDNKKDKKIIPQISIPSQKYQNFGEGYEDEELEQNKLITDQNIILNKDNKGNIISGKIASKKNIGQSYTLNKRDQMKKASVKNETGLEDTIIILKKSNIPLGEKPIARPIIKKESYISYNISPKKSALNIAKEAPDFFGFEFNPIKTDTKASDDEKFDDKTLDSQNLFSQSETNSINSDLLKTIEKNNLNFSKNPSRFTSPAVTYDDVAKAKEREREKDLKRLSTKEDERLINKSQSETNNQSSPLKNKDKSNESKYQTKEDRDNLRKSNTEQEDRKPSIKQKDNPFRKDQKKTNNCDIEEENKDKLIKETKLPEKSSPKKERLIARKDIKDIENEPDYITSSKEQDTPVKAEKSANIFSKLSGSKYASNKLELTENNEQVVRSPLKNLSQDKQDNKDKEENDNEKYDNKNKYGKNRVISTSNKNLDNDKSEKSDKSPIKNKDSKENSTTNVINEAEVVIADKVEKVEKVSISGKNSKYSTKQEPEVEKLDRNANKNEYSKDNKGSNDSNKPFSMTKKIETQEDQPIKNRESNLNKESSKKNINNDVSSPVKHKLISKFVEPEKEQSPLKHKDNNEKVIKNPEKPQESQIKQKDSHDKEKPNEDRQIKEKIKIDIEPELKKIEEKTEILTKDDLIIDQKLKSFEVEDFAILNQIGEGSFGKIYLVEQKDTKERFSLKKIIAEGEEELQIFTQEFELVNSIRHPGILRIIGSCHRKLDFNTMVLYILMEVAKYDWDKEIKQQIMAKKPYSSELIVKICCQTISGLAHLQKINISHRDIKPQNILVFENNIYKVADFGEAKEFQKSKQMSTLRGTEMFMSPVLFEALKYNIFDVTHNAYKSDVYSLGLCVVYAIAGNIRIINEFRNVRDDKQTLFLIKKIVNKNYDQKLVILLGKMLELKEDKRPDFIQLEAYVKGLFS